MKEYVEVPSTRKELKAIKCDLCGRKSNKETWTASHMDETIKVSYDLVGSLGYDSGFGKHINIDLCPRCFNEVLVPFLKGQGATIKVVETEW